MEEDYKLSITIRNIDNICENFYLADMKNNIYAADFRYKTTEEMEENFKEFSSLFNKKITLTMKDWSLFTGKIVGIRKDRYYNIYDKIIIFLEKEK